MKCFFYKSIVDGFSEILKFHEEIDYSGFPIDQKVAYLHNSAVLEAIQTYFWGFDSAKVKQFVQNIAASRKERCSLDILTFIVVILKRDFRCTKP